MARTYTVLTATDIRALCSYLGTNSINCGSFTTMKVNDSALPAGYQNYQVCDRHFAILYATDQSKFTSSGNQRNDQVINTTVIADDVGYWTAANKDSKNKGNTQKTYVPEPNHP